MKAFILLSIQLITIVIGQQRLSPHNEKRKVKLTPKLQNIPLDYHYKGLRPPKPIVSTKTPTIFIGLSVFRDGNRCGKTIFTGFKRSKYPHLLTFGVIDQLESSDESCLNAYCILAKKEWPEEECKYKSRIRYRNHVAHNSKGPTLARHYQQQLINNEEFCLQVDGHSIFTNNWDQNIFQDWLQINNEMAVLSTYIHHPHTSIVQENGDVKPPSQLPHLCKTKRGVRGLIRNEGASMLHNVTFPQMSALWGAGLSFNKCHAEKRVPVDPYTFWMFDGEEFLRASRLWTHGYDFYSPSRLGSVVYHNYSKVPKRFEHIKIDKNKKSYESKMGTNRYNLLLGIPFEGVVNTTDLNKYGFGIVRSFQSYLKFAGITLDVGKNDTGSCKQLHWIPYENSTEINTFLPEKKIKPIRLNKKRINWIKKKKKNMVKTLKLKARERERKLQDSQIPSHMEYPAQHEKFIIDRTFISICLIMLILLLYVVGNGWRLKFNQFLYGKYKLRHMH